MVFAGTMATALGLFALDAALARAGADGAVTTRAAATAHAPSLRVLDWSLWNVARHYLDPDRVDPSAMITASFEEIERQVPEVIVSFSDGKDAATVRVSTHERTIPIPDDAALWDVGILVADVLAFVRQHADLDDERRREVEYAVVNAALATLDPHSMLLPPRVFEDMKTSTQGSFGGLGIEIGMREGFITVIRVIDGNPASRVDMRPGDRIVQIDGDSTVTMTLDEAVKLLRGPPGTTVSVYVMREGLAKPKRLDITRAIIKLDSVVGTVVDVPASDGQTHKVGVIQISRNFAQTTPRELHDTLESFRKERVEALLLDLRDNPGGLLTSAVAVADAFLSSGMIVATVGRDPNARDESYADTRYDYDPVPLVVLVNQFSASASEIVAGSLENLGRAVVLGRQTFGKGSVQALYERRYGEDELALKLTIAQYLIAGDVSIQGVGVVPTIETIPAYVGKKYIEYFGRRRFSRLREGALDHALAGMAPPPGRAPAMGPLYFLGQGSVGRKSEKPSKDEPADAARARLLLDDPEVRIGARIALALPAPAQAPVEPSSLAPTVQALAAEEEQRITQSLASLGIDWQPPPADVSPATLRVVFAGAATDQAPTSTFTVAAGETTTLKARVTNLGDQPAYRVRAITDSEDPYLDEREFLFGRIDPGETVERTLEVAVGEHERSHIDRVLVSLSAAGDVRTSPDSTTHFDLVAQGRKRPRFAVGLQVLDDPSLGGSIQGNGDGRLQVGERVAVRVDVRNDGPGDALDTWVTLRNRSGSAVFLHTGRARLEDIGVGATKTGTLDLELREVPEHGEAPMRILVSDNKVAEVLAERIVLPVASDAPAAQAPPTRKVTAPAGTVIYGSADLRRPIARTRAATRLSATGVFGPALRVRIGDRIGFVRTEQVDPRAAGKKARLEPILSITPPRIEVDPPPLSTGDPTIVLRGRARDETAVRDLYVTVYNPAKDRFRGGDKVYYVAADDPTKGELSFEARVPLAPGLNRIELFAREDRDLQGQAVFWVFRTSGWEEAHARRRAAGR